MQKLNIAYEYIIEPCNIREQFDSVSDFIVWLNLGSVKDLQCTLEVFEKAEMYLDCTIIKKIIHEKTNAN